MRIYGRANRMQISFRCPNPECDYTIRDDVDDADFDWTNDSPGDGINTATSFVTCSYCDEEYTVEVIAKGGEKDVIVHDHRDVVVDFHDNTYDLLDDYDDFLADYDPPEPYTVFQQSLDDLADLEKSTPTSPSAKSAFLKMMYLQYVVILEAYLSDRLIRLVMDDPKKLLALVGASAALRDSSTKFIDIVKDPEHVTKKTKEYLQRMSFHNIDSVCTLYSAVLKTKIFGNEQTKNELKSIIENRHHLVHRSGRDNEGRQVPVKEMSVYRVKQLVSDVVKRVEDAHTEYKRELALQPVDDDFF